MDIETEIKLLEKKKRNLQLTYIENVGEVEEKLKERIETLEAIKKQKYDDEKHKSQSIEYNLQYLTEALERQNTSEMFDIVSSIVHTLKLLASSAKAVKNAKRIPKNR